MTDAQDSSKPTPPAGSTAEAVCNEGEDANSQSLAAVKETRSQAAALADKAAPKVAESPTKAAVEETKAAVTKLAGVFARPLGKNT
jgi:hypothetical protein